MRRRTRINVLLLAAAIGLGGLAWLLEARRDAAATLTGIDPADVRALSIGYPRQPDRSTLGLERRKDGWHLVSPIRRPARDGRVVTALAVLGATPKSCYDAAEHDPARFGLARPAAVMKAGDIKVAFGDRSADGRRYVSTGDRLCLLPDRAYPLLARGLDGLARLSLLPAGVEPLAIVTPSAAAERRSAASPWRVMRGDGDAGAWATHWIGARATGILLEPPADNLGDIRVRAADGTSYRWRLARRGGETVLVPANADFGLVLDARQADDLLGPSRPGAED